jgi:hypothetical protein
MRPIKNWSVLVPAVGPKPVEQMREQVEALRAKIAVARERVEAAKLALAQAEQHDREQMSNAIRKNVEPTSEVAKVEKLRSARWGRTSCLRDRDGRRRIRGRPGRSGRPAP